MKKMNKSALALACLLSVSMMGTTVCYAASGNGHSTVETESDGTGTASEGKKITQGVTPKTYTVPSGVSVEGIDISGMTTEEAEEAVNTFVSQTAKGTLTFTVGSDKLEVPYADIGMTVKDYSAIEEACAIGSNGSLVNQYKELTSVAHDKTDYHIELTIDADKLTAYLEENAASYETAPVEPTINISGGNISVVEGQAGKTLDTAATAAAVEANMGEEWNHGNMSVDIAFTEEQPKYTADDLKEVKDVIGTYSTTYGSSSENRKKNIANGASLIDGTLIYPGEEFSFLNNVVPFTSDNGYYKGTGYSGGKIVDSMGGGICQVSSTLYNTVLRAELEITERSNHGLTVGYVPLGADATIAESSVDFKFKNNYDTPVYIEAYTSGSTIYITIYGKETRPSNRTLEFVSVTEQTLSPGEDVVTEDSALPDGYSEVTQSAHTGYVASFYKYVYVDGELADKIKINTSTYRATPRYVTKGTHVETEAPTTQTPATEAPATETETPATETTTTQASQ